MTAMFGLPPLPSPPMRDNALPPMSTTMPAMDSVVVDDKDKFRGHGREHLPRSAAIGMRASIALNQLLKLKGRPLIIVHG